MLHPSIDYISSYSVITAYNRYHNCHNRHKPHNISTSYFISQKKCIEETISYKNCLCKLSQPSQHLNILFHLTKVCIGK
jgi:hypothetical protein